jgi:hypothetical protein
MIYNENIINVEHTRDRQVSFTNKNFTFMTVKDNHGKIRSLYAGSTVIQLDSVFTVCLQGTPPHI